MNRPGPIRCICWTIAFVAFWSGVAAAAPVASGWPSPGAGPKTVAAAGLGGLWATSNGIAVEVRDIRQQLRLSMTLTDLATALPGMDPATGRIARLCFSESGRLLFVLVQRPGNGEPGVTRWEETVRIDTDTGTFTRFTSDVITPDRASLPPMPIAHFGGRLSFGNAGGVTRRWAQRNDLVGSSAGSVATQFGVGVTAVAVDRVGGFVFAVDANGAFFRMPATGSPSTPLGNVGVGAVSAAFSEHYGGAANAGLYIGMSDGRVRFVPASSARGVPPVIATDYTLGAGPQIVSADAEGGLLVGDDAGVRRITDTSDSRMGFEPWLVDEVLQQITFAKGLVSPQGEPAGWVIDGDVAPGGTLFHPATPDGAAWVVLMLTAADELFHDPQARPLVRSVLRRYAGQAGGPAPSRSADGIFRHWIDPATGGVKSGWDPEFATMSTMKIVAAAARAQEHFFDDAQIVSAARQICCSVHNWDGYVNPSGRWMYLKGLAGGGADLGSGSQPFHEGIIFTQEAAFYGGPNSASTYNQWLNRSAMQGASYLTNRRIAANFNGFAPAFTSVYPVLLVDDYRARSDWLTQVAEVSSAAAAWTDDNGPRWFTVFSAGTTKPEWGGYHADAINNAPGNVSTFTALCGLAGRADGLGVREATAAYHAYRTGARQAFRSGANLLYRRSNGDPAWTPTDAGLPDVTMGGLGLADLLSPGLIDRVLARGFPLCGACAADVGKVGGVVGPDGVVDNNDFVVFIDAFFRGDRLVADVGSVGGTAGADGMLDNNDFVVFVDAFFSGCGQ